MPRVLPLRSAPTLTCQPPERTDVVSTGIWRAAAWISAQVSSGAPFAAPPVLQTVMRRALAASRSMEAFWAALEPMNRNRGSRSRMEPGRGVRSRMTHTASNGSNRATSASGSSMWS